MRIAGTCVQDRRRNDRFIAELAVDLVRRFYQRILFGAWNRGFQGSSVLRLPVQVV